ncbi:MAG: hypothetical protein M1832_002766 [Thelocarpon impressellum]|nr:MAG: hypothetical protein M1832_002766 [Thelocarpon impressellum]
MYAAKAYTMTMPAKSSSSAASIWGTPPSFVPAAAGKAKVSRFFGGSKAALPGLATGVTSGPTTTPLAANRWSRSDRSGPACPGLSAAIWGDQVPDCRKGVYCHTCDRDRLSFEARLRRILREGPASPKVIPAFNPATLDARTPFVGDSVPAQLPVLPSWLTEVEGETEDTGVLAEAEDYSTTDSDSECSDTSTLLTEMDGDESGLMAAKMDEPIRSDQMGHRFFGVCPPPAA